MKRLLIHDEKITDASSFMSLCPFGALEADGGKIRVSAGCRMCGLCVKNCGNGEAEFIETYKTADVSDWKNICVYAEIEDGVLHPITFELIGKARELSDVVGCKITALLIGSGRYAEELQYYGVDEVYVYEHECLNRFVIEPYAAVFEDFIINTRPSVILVGATQTGRQLAPRVAARFETGLTADCTELEIDNNSELIQIRPAFGGNIMARIVTKNHRPQMATIRYKVMKAPERNPMPGGIIINKRVTENMLKTGMLHVSSQRKERVKSIENAEVIVAAGRGVKSREDLQMVRRLADVLDGELACSRPLTENGWVEARRQIGLSGRTVRPKLFIACGVSGSVQFIAGMKGAECIFAINKDADAAIFKSAHYGAVGDIYEIIPELIAYLTKIED